MDNGKGRILIVDDDPMNTKVLKAILQFSKYDVITSSNGEEGIDAVYDQSPDLILLDVMMPGMNGLEVTRKLKTESKTKDIPIVLITGLDRLEYESRGKDAGAEDFLSKPIRKNELLGKVSSLLELRC